MTTLHEYFVYDGDDPQVELGDAPISIDYLLLDNFPIRFFCELAAIEAGRAQKPLHPVNSGWVLGGEVDDRRQHRLLHAGELKEHPASEERADLHEVILTRIEIYLVGPLDGGHLVRAHLIQAEYVNPHVLLKYSFVAEEYELRDGAPLRLPLIRHDGVWSGGQVGPLHLYEALRGDRREDMALFLPTGPKKIFATQLSFPQQMTKTGRSHQHYPIISFNIALGRIK